MPKYHTEQNAIHEGTRQVCVILPVSCTRAEAMRMTKLLAEAMNREAEGGKDG